MVHDLNRMRLAVVTALLLGCGADDRAAAGASGDACVDAGRVCDDAPRSVITSVSAHGPNTCVTNGCGGVYCWGESEGGAAGVLASAVSSPQRVRGVDDVGAVRVGDGFVLAERTDGVVFGWGDNFYGSLGSIEGGSFAARIPEVPRHAQGLSAGQGSSAWAVDGGFDYLGAGILDLDFSATPRFAAIPGSPVRQIAIAGVDICATTQSGDVYCLRDQSEALDTFPDAVNVTKLPGVPAIQEVALGQDSTFGCALARDGSVYCWGANDYGQLGTPVSILHQLTFAPVKVPGLPPARAISAGADNVCAIANTGEVNCWGLNDVGELGRGTWGWQPLPAGPVAGLAQVATIAIGLGHGCALTTAAELFCWGMNGEGEVGVGDNQTGYFMLPQRVELPAAPGADAGAGG